MLKEPRRQCCSTFFGKCLPKIVSPVCRKNGFFSAGLVLDWGNIVGDKYSKECRPVRISGIPPRCCLYVGASRSAAVQLVYVVPQLLERIRQYFGKNIIETIRFVDYEIPENPSFEATRPRQRKAFSIVDSSMTIPENSGMYPPLGDALNRLAFAIEAEAQENAFNNKAVLHDNVA
ncbi:MAG: DUF721 domain-containing protein [Holosporales bacterium]|jgi:hypothetical protein|nr:DUF721 domain-containing protein [Holosporales bacterium]